MASCRSHRCSTCLPELPRLLCRSGGCNSNGSCGWGASWDQPPSASSACAVRTSHPIRALAPREPGQAASCPGGSRCASVRAQSTTSFMIIAMRLPSAAMSSAVLSSMTHAQPGCGGQVHDRLCEQGRRPGYFPAARTSRPRCSSQRSQIAPGAVSAATSTPVRSWPATMASITAGDRNASRSTRVM